MQERRRGQGHRPPGSQESNRKGEGDQHQWFGQTCAQDRGPGETVELGQGHLLEPSFLTADHQPVEHEEGQQDQLQVDHHHDRRHRAGPTPVEAEGVEETGRRH